MGLPSRTSVSVGTEDSGFDDLGSIALAGLQNAFRGFNMLDWDFFVHGKMGLELDDSQFLQNT